MTNIRLPNITATTDAGKLQQLQSFMYQLVEQLNWALQNVESQASEAKEVVKAAASSGKVTDKEAQSTFNSIKSLIIKSADIVNAYYEVINKRLEGLFVAKSDFGTYTEKTAQTITENSTGIDLLFTNIQSITDTIDNIGQTLIEVNARIHPGLLDYDKETGAPIYGLEIGQRTEIDGVEVFNKYARFTAEKLSFYDSNGNEVAYISDKKLYITHIEVTGSYKIGGLVDKALSDGSVITRYEASGGEE